LLGVDQVDLLHSHTVAGEHPKGGHAIQQIPFDDGPNARDGPAVGAGSRASGPATQRAPRSSPPVTRAASALPSPTPRGGLSGCDEWRRGLSPHERLQADRYLRQVRNVLTLSLSRVT